MSIPQTFLTEFVKNLKENTIDKFRALLNKIPQNIRIQTINSFPIKNPLSDEFKNGDSLVNLVIMKIKYDKKYPKTSSGVKNKPTAFLDNPNELLDFVYGVYIIEEAIKILIEYGADLRLVKYYPYGYTVLDGMTYALETCYIGLVNLFLTPEIEFNEESMDIISRIGPSNDITIEGYPDNRVDILELIYEHGFEDDESCYTSDDTSFFHNVIVSRTLQPRLYFLLFILNFCYDKFKKKKIRGKMVPTVIYDNPSYYTDDDTYKQVNIFYNYLITNGASFPIEQLKLLLKPIKDYYVNCINAKILSHYDVDSSAQIDDNCDPDNAKLVLPPITRAAPAASAASAASAAPAAAATKRKRNEITINFDITKENCLDIITNEEIVINEFIKDKNNLVFVFYTDYTKQPISIGIDMTATVDPAIVQEYAVESSNNKPFSFREKIFGSTDYLVYACKRTGTMKPSNIITYPVYFDIKSIAGFGDLIFKEDADYIKGDIGSQVYIFKKTDVHLISTISYKVKHGNEDDYSSIRGCKEGQSAAVYELIHDVNLGPSIGGKNKKNTKKKRNKPNRNKTNRNKTKINKTKRNKT